MTFANPAALALLALALPVVLLHMLRPRRPVVDVSSTFLWREVSRPVSAAVPWQPLRMSALLVLQLLAVALFAIAAARPVRTTEVPLSRHTVFILDTSASMRATDWHPDRLSRAKAEALELREQVPDNGLASLIVASAEPYVALTASADPGAFSDAVRPIGAGAAGADFGAAFALAQSLETPGVPIGFVLLSDGVLDADARRLIPPGTRYVPVGVSSANTAVSRLIVERSGSGSTAGVTMRNVGTEDERTLLRVDVDGRTVARANVVLPAGEVVERSFEVPTGELVEAGLDGGDVFADDDRAFAVAEQRRAVDVLLAGPRNVFWERALGAIPGVRVKRSTASRSARGSDLAVYAGVAVPRDPGAPFVAVAPPGGMGGIAVSGSIDAPAPVFVDGADELLAGVDLSDVAIRESQRITASGDEVLLAAERTPLIVRGTRAGRPFVYLAFAVEDTDLPLQIAFPILVDRVVSELAGVPATRDLRAGEVLALQTADAVTVEGPGGRRITVDAGAAEPVADRPGFWRIREGDGAERVVAVNVPAAESLIAPAAKLPIRAAERRPGERTAAGQSSMLGWVVLALACVLLPELWLSWRTSGVTRTQWRTALGVRAAIAMLLLAALLGVDLPRTGNSVATIFAIDASDSMGAVGRAEAVRFVQDALDEMPKDAKAGVVVFGGDARVENAVQQTLRFSHPAAQVDASRTDVGAGLRLAGALAPSDARRRIVLISDGRPTQGDAAEEITRLRRAGVRVDVKPIAVNAGDDAAVATLDAPDLVREGESFTLRATLESTRQQSVRLALRRDGKIVDERVANVGVGETVVEFERPPDESGVHRYQLDMSATSNSVPDNDVGYAAVVVEGPATVLVVSESAEQSRDLNAALTAGGVRTRTVTPDELPPLDELATYQSIVLVDVEARALSEEQTGSLQAAVRDLGRGLVAVGGTRSFALGGYLDSDLEKVLPVRSELTDPKRRASVAEVLAIDTSGSMGACHCDPRRPTGFGGDRGEGGINKTDIARAGAERAIRALHQSDQVGVLAFNTEERWIVPLQQLPTEKVVRDGLAKLRAAGGTNLHNPLAEAADELTRTKAQLKHIILFTDGWSNTKGLAEDAAALAKKGITISVLATGEGAGDELRKVAEAGRGRFYPGEDLSRVPQIMMEETIIASRQFVNEGEFFPTVKADAPATRGLTQTPALLGYVGVTAKPTAQTLLEIGDERDPLLTTWRTGLGRATAWTSDASVRWSQRWASWDGYTDFWSAVVKDTFPLAGATGATVDARFEGDRLVVSVERDAGWPAGSKATVRVTRPGLGGVSEQLVRSQPSVFDGEIDAGPAGVYAVGAQVTHRGRTIATGTALATRSYSAEYRPGRADPDLLERLSTQAGGRGAIRASQAFDPAGLVAGHGRIPLAGWLLLLAALLWPVDVALRRLALQHSVPATAAKVRGAVTRVGLLARRRPRAEPGAQPRPDAVDDDSPDAAPPREVSAPAPPATIGRLLERKRNRNL